MPEDRGQKVLCISLGFDETKQRHQKQHFLQEGAPVEEDDDNDNVQEGAVLPSGQTVSLDRAKGCRLWVQQRLIILIRSYNKLDVI